MRWVALAFFLMLRCMVSAQDFSNKGKDFWLGYGNHVQMYISNNQRMSLYITSDVNTSGNVEIPGISFSTPFAIQANQITEIEIPNSAVLRDEGISNMGIHVTATSPVVVYGHIYFNAVSGATLCLPTPTLGREYISVNYTQVSNQANSHSYFFVVATEDNTTVEITPAAGTLGGRAEGVPFEVNLNKGQTYQVLSENDLTGSNIRSIDNGSGCKRIAVFCGSGKIAIGCGSSAGSSDNLYQQMYPTQTWGRRYVLVPSAVRSLNYYRIVKKDPAAVVTLNGNIIDPADFTDGLYYEFSSSQTCFVSSDRPILAAQYFTTQQNCGLEENVQGDPDMIFLNPVEQTLKEVTLNSSGKYNIRRHFINVAIRNGGTGVSSFKVDGQSTTASFKPLPQNPDYSYAQISVSEGTHNLSCDSGFNAMAYGFGGAESYGYSAGTNLVDLYQFITIKNPAASVTTPTGCADVPFECAITFPYEPNTIQWDFNGLFPGIDINNPVPDLVYEKDGRTLYEYRLTHPFTIEQAGTYEIRVTADNPFDDGCSGVQEISYELVVYDPPEAKMEIPSSSVCEGAVLEVKDASEGNGGKISRWEWMLEDASLFNSQDITQAFTVAGEFDLQLKVITESGCVSEQVTQTIKVHPKPIADFGLKEIACGGKEILFQPKSTIPEGRIQTHEWNWGNGESSTGDATEERAKTYSPGKYTITLAAVSAEGCRSEPFSEEITVFPTPVAVFETPKICVDDPVAVFRNFSYVDGGGALSADWRFDGASAGQSTEKEPSVNYAVAGDFPVTLQVISEEGCTHDTTEIITVNGNIPISDFEISTGKLCAGESLIITNQSSVNAGNIIRTEIYWDYQRDITLKTVDDAPAPGKKYSMVYPSPGAIQTITVLLVAYSGAQCVSQQAQEVTLLPEPRLTIEAPENICSTAPPVVFNAVRENTGIPGVGTYWLRGNLLENGVLDPAVAGAGNFDIHYTFTADNDCAVDTSFPFTIHPTPAVNAGPDIYVLEGGTGELKGNVSGSGNIIQWSPATGLTGANSLSPAVFGSSGDKEYTLEAVSEFGCAASDKAMVFIQKNPQIPNVFSPNGDGVNDTWNIPYLNTYTGCKVEVYNRNGQLLFRSIGYHTPWNGRWNNAALPGGTYYYIIEPGGGRPVMKGSVTIIY